MAKATDRRTFRIVSVDSLNEFVGKVGVSGRVVIPRVIRRLLRIYEGNMVLVTVEKIEERDSKAFDDARTSKIP
ncbi:MAG: hypothetical protein ACE5OZ_25435 [Candidatus Heimdallarchaeota archaeon]